MAVILPNAFLRVRKRAHPYARDRWGKAVAPAEPGPWSEPVAGGVKEQPSLGLEQGAAWSVRLPVDVWPLERGDEIDEPSTGRRWVVDTARDHRVVGHPDVDYVAVSATLDPPEVP